MTQLGFSITTYMAMADPDGVIHISAFPEGYMGGHEEGDEHYRTLCKRVASNKDGWAAWVSDEIKSTDSIDCTDARSTDEATCPKCIAERKVRAKEYSEYMKRENKKTKRSKT